MAKRGRPRKNPPPEPAPEPGQEPSQVSQVNLEQVKNEIIGTLKRELQEAVKISREDILKDVHEQLDKQKIKTPAINPGMDLSMIKNLLGGMGINEDQKKQFEEIFSKIPGSSMPAAGAAPGQVPDMDKMSEGQLKWLSSQNQNQMLMTVLPMIMNKTGGAFGESGMMQELLMRTMLDKFSTGMFMEKAFMAQLSKMIGNPKLYQEFEAKQNNYVGSIMNTQKPMQTGGAAPIGTGGMKLG